MGGKGKARGWGWEMKDGEVNEQIVGKEGKRKYIKMVVKKGRERL